MAGLTERLRVVASERMATGGDAIARLDDGRVLFVEGALPGESVEVEVSRWHRDYARGRVLHVVEPSAERVDPPCPHHHAGCGGCGWMHVAADAQIALKQRIVAEALRRAGHTGSPEQLAPRGV